MRTKYCTLSISHNELTEQQKRTVLNTKQTSKVKCSLVQALRLCTGSSTYRRSRGIALLFLDHGTRRGWGSGSRPGRSLPPGKTRYSLYRRLVGPQGLSGQVRKISPLPGFDPRTVQPVANRCTDYATRPTLTHWTYIYRMRQEDKSVA